MSHYITQSVVIPKKYMNLTQAKKWIKLNGYHIEYGIDEKVNVWRFRQILPTKFKPKSYRTITLDNGVEFVRGILK